MSSSTGSRLFRLAQRRLTPLWARVLSTPWPARVQRIGSQALQRVAARFPALAELLGKAARSARNNGRGERYPAAEVASFVAGESERRSADILQTQMTSPSWQARARAIAQLGTTPDVSHVESLIGALRDDSAEVAAAAALALGAQGGQAARAALQEALENRDGFFNPVTRAAAVQGLARCLPTAESGPLEAALTDVDAEVSLAAIAALAERAPGVAAASLLPIVKDATGYFLPMVRLAAATALVRAGGLAPAELAGLLAQEADPMIQAALAGANS